MSRALLIKRPNILSLPGGINPGFDASHPAAQGIVNGKGLSAIAIGGNFVSLLNGTSFTITGAPTAAIVPIIGPVTKFTGTASASLAGQSTTASGKLTFAAITQFDSLVSARQALIGDGNNQLGLQTSHTIEIFYNSLSHSLVAATTGIPYFIAASVLSGIRFSYVVVNLRTGAILVNGTTANGNVLTVPGGTLWIGNNSAGTVPTLGGIAAAMYAPTYMSPQQLLAWAQDPWSFWYPPTFDLPQAMGIAGPYARLVPAVSLGVKETQQVSIASLM